MTASIPHGPADELRQAAAKVRETAAKVENAGHIFLDEEMTDWEKYYGHEATAELPDGDGPWIALMSPELAEPLAAWLDDTADTHQGHEADGATWCRYCAETWPCGNTKHALKVARAITGGAS